jgi:polyhydroxybutyrate depolymerase
MSMGSVMTFLQVCERPRRFAAFAGVGFPVFLPNCPSPPAPVLAVHGTADQVVPYAGGLTASTASAPPAEPTMHKWALREACRRYVRSVPAPGITLRSWDRCRAGAQVQFYTVHGGRHVWPRSPRLDAGETMWRFFQRYRLAS